MMMPFTRTVTINTTGAGNLAATVGTRPNGFMRVYAKVTATSDFDVGTSWYGSDLNILVPSITASTGATGATGAAGTNGLGGTAGTAGYGNPFHTGATGYGGNGGNGGNGS